MANEGIKEVGTGPLADVQQVGADADGLLEGRATR